MSERSRAQSTVRERYPDLVNALAIRQGDARYTKHDAASNEVCVIEDPAITNWKPPKVGTYLMTWAGVMAGAYMGALLEPYIATTLKRFPKYPADGLFAALVSYTFAVAGPRLIKDFHWRQIVIGFFAAYAGASYLSFTRRQTQQNIQKLMEIIEEAAA